MNGPGLKTLSHSTHRVKIVVKSLKLLEVPNENYVPTKSKVEEYNWVKATCGHVIN